MIRILFLLSIFFSNFCYAESTIRDDEIESAINKIVKPIAKAAGLNDNLHIYIVNDKSINAFATKGNNIYLNSGLIIESKTPDMLAGVIAHEIGHIKAGHPLLRKDAIANTQLFDTAAMLLGVASMIAGNPKLGASIAIGGSYVSQQQMYQYTRLQEQAADQAAINFLKGSDIPLEGTLDILKTLSKYDNKHFHNLYTRTHPFASERAAIVKNNLSNEKTHDKYKYIKKFEYDLARIKLESFLAENQGRHYLKKLVFKSSDEEFYAKSIINMRLSNFKEAHKYIDFLIDHYPENPYFYEHKAQIYLEQRKFEEAVNYYLGALKFQPNSELLNLQIALTTQALSEQKKAPELLHKAIDYVNKAIKINPSYLSFHLASDLYGRIGDIGAREYFLAEQYLISDNLQKAKYHAEIAKKNMNKNHKYYIQVLDILNE